MSIQNPTFTVFTGSMFSFKTTKLLSSIERFKFQHKVVAAFKPTIDDRYASLNIVSHSGWSWPAVPVRTGADILEELARLSDEPGAVAVDEAFMIPGIAEVLIWLYKNGVNIVVSTLDISSSGKPFREVEKLLVWATHVEKCVAVCTVCGCDARYTHKKQVDDDNEIHVGGSELYEPRCWCHIPFIANHVPGVKLGA